MQQLQILQDCKPQAVNHRFDGLKEPLMFNTRLFGGTSSKDFLSSLMGDNERQLKFIRNIFRGRDDVSLYIVDHAVETPFHCILMANFIKQLGEFLGISYKGIKLFVSPVSSRDTFTGYADDTFESSDKRNGFLLKAHSKIVGTDCKLSCKRFHLRKEDIKLITNDYTLHIRPLRPDGGLTHGWHIEGGDYPLMTPTELLYHHHEPISCYNTFSRSKEKNGLLINIELEPHTNSPFLMN